jgi:hypothetical protein
MLHVGLRGCGGRFGDALGFDAVGGGDGGDDILRQGAKADGLGDGGLDILASHRLVGGVAAHDRLQIADDRGGLLLQERGIGGDGVEILLAGEAVGGEMVDHGLDVADDGRQVLAEVGVGGDGLEVFLVQGRLGMVVPADIDGGAGGVERLRIGGRRVLRAVRGVAGGGAVEQCGIAVIGHGESPTW